MKKLLAVTLAIIMVLSLTISASAVQFVESITNKNAPSLVIIDRTDGKDVVGSITDPDGNKVSTEYLECLIITSITDALAGKDAPEGVNEELIKVYNELKDGVKISEVCPELKDVVKDKWGAGKDVDDLVIKDLFDVTDYCEDIPTHLKGGSILDLTFDLGISSNTFITAMVYVDGKWQPVVDTINNGDGTVTVKFDKICPVAFLVPGSGENMSTVSPTTSDASGIILWGSVMAVSLLAIFALVIFRRRVNG